MATKHVCEVCGKETALKLMPDFSSGLWCDKCGVGYANPSETLPDIPDGLLSLVDGWLVLWDINISYDHTIVRRDYMEGLLDRIGTELCKQIGKFYECVYYKEV